MFWLIFFLLQWASELSSHLLSIHDDETLRRQEFDRQFQDHFLTALFTGLEDMPPPYGAQSPAIFDNRLPNLAQNGTYLLITVQCKLFFFLIFFLSRIRSTSFVRYYTGHSVKNRTT